MADEFAAKTEEPTPKKLSDARKKGDVAKSMDIPQLASLAGAFGVMAIGGGWFLRDMAMHLLPFVAHPDEIELSGQGAMQVVFQAGLAAAPLTITVLAGAGVAGGIGYLAQTGFMLTGEKLKPEAKKISPLEGFKRIFEVEGLVQFLKSVLKIAVTGWVAWLVLKPRAADLSALASMEPAAMLPLSADLTKALFYAVMTFLALTAGLDWFWQRQRFTARMRMSREELKEEYKQSDGDPHVKAKQKQIRAERSRRRMMQNVPNATVVIMNPNSLCRGAALRGGADRRAGVCRQGRRRPRPAHPGPGRGQRRGGDRGPAAGPRPVRRRRCRPADSRSPFRGGGQDHRLCHERRPATRGRPARQTALASTIHA